MKPDKEHINELERQLADSWRTAKTLKNNYDDMTQKEIMEELSELKVDIVLEDGTIAEMIQRMKLAVFVTAYFTLGSVYHYMLGRTWRLAEEAMQESDMLDMEIAAFKLVAVVFWPLFLCLDIVFPE